ncbi:MAG: hypothetical protein WAS27_01380, partial [Candidatus Saccharimonadales bacterium]
MGTEENKKEYIQESTHIDQSAGTAQSPHDTVNSKSKIAAILKKKKLVIILISSVLLVMCGAVATLVMTQKTPGAERTNTTPTKGTKPKEVAKMGIAASVIDGTVTYQNQGSSAWDALTPATQLAEG